MKAYVEIVQRKERELGTDVLTHQKVHLLPSFGSPGTSELTDDNESAVEWCRVL